MFHFCMGNRQNTHYMYQFWQLLAKMHKEKRQNLSNYIS